ncbi:MAG: hypothetical protein EBS36_06980 [Actinobacteria bacterium]|nr:hypothetical protein [Actinomycetota bacterium]NBY15548.1 hypothetical protein [Actinomycetota bacterium]
MSRIFKYEFIRARSLKSTWIFPVIGIALSWLIAYFGLKDADLMMNVEGMAVPPTFALAINNSFSPLSIFFITIPFAQAFGHEFRDGTMRLTLSAYPQRARVFVAKLLIPSVLAIVSGLIAMAGIFFLYKTFISVQDYSGALNLAGRHIAFTIVWGLIVAAVVIFSRNLAAGVAGVVVWAAILEQIVAGLLSTRWPKVVDYLPLSKGMEWASGGQTKDLIVIATATVITVGLAGMKFLKRDA